MEGFVYNANAGGARPADLARANPYWNPQALDRDGIERLIEAARIGTRPGP